MKLEKEGLNDIEKSNHYDRRISFALIFQFCMVITSYAIKEIFQISNPSVRVLISLILMVLVGWFYLNNLNTVFKRNGSSFIFSYIFFILVILISALLNGDIIQFLPNIVFWMLLICLPTAQYFLAIKNQLIFLNMLITSGYYQMILGLLVFISMLLTASTYDMGFSYLILIPMIILTYKLFFLEFKTKDIILVIAAFFSILTVGSRGPLLAYLIFILLLVINYLMKYKLSPRVLIVIILSTILLLFVILNFDGIINELNSLLNNYGIQSRTIYLLSTDDIDFSTGRFEIFTKTIVNIKSNPLTGFGIAGDRVFLDGTYPHNIFLEIISQFGIVLGGLLSVILLIYWFSGIFLNKNTTAQHLAIIFSGLGLISLFYSGSYLISSNFWLFMAICISSVHSVNGKTIDNKLDDSLSNKVIAHE